MGNKLNTHYTITNEGARLFSSKANSIEYYTNMHFLNKYLKPSSKIIELGAGHGFYSTNLAENGHFVTATDIVAENVQQIQKSIESKGICNLKAQIVDATDLTGFSDSEFDACLCLGPYYHLRHPDLRKKCILETSRIVRKDGFIAVAYINRTFALAYYNKNKIFFSRRDYEDLAKREYSRTDFSDSFLNISFFTSPQEIEEEIGSYGLTIAEHLASDGIYTMIKNEIETMTEDEFEALLDFHIKTSPIVSTLGASCHNLLIVKNG